MLKIVMTEKRLNLDVGHADIYVGPAFEIPYFFESPGRKMMREPGYDNINFRTWDGEFFQFFLDTFHSHQALVLTSTLGDCCFFSYSRLGIEKMREYATAQSNKKHPIKNSFSGYFTFGQKMLKQYDTLEQHMKEQEIYFSDETLEKICEELQRRAKDAR